MRGWIAAGVPCVSALPPAGYGPDPGAECGIRTARPCGFRSAAIVRAVTVQRGVLLLLCAAALFSAQPNADEPHWHVDWATAQRIAAKTNKPIFAVLVCKH